MAFVNRRSDLQQSSREAGGETVDFNPLDDSVVKVHYDLSAWNYDQHAELAEALAEAAVPHAWNGTELVVPESVEVTTDAVIERLETAYGPRPIALESAAASVEFGLDEWTGADRQILTDALIEAEIPHRWEGSTVLVAADAEESVDDLLDAIESGDLMTAEESAGSYARDGVLSELFLATNRIVKSPYDAKSRNVLMTIAAESSVERPPYAFSPALWGQVMSQLNALIVAFGADAVGVGDLDDDAGVVATGAEQLATLLRPFV